MLQIRKNVSLKPFNTFGIDARCSYFAEVTSVKDLVKLFSEEIYQTQPKLIIGGGSNLLFTKDFEGLVVRNSLKGIKILKEEENLVLIEAAAGEIWHDLVIYCINRGFGGLENLSLIPGCVGASPMQNIGAYGAEIKETFVELDAFEINTGKIRVFNKTECEFGYRESVFKNKEKNKYIITSVRYQLTKKAKVNTSYGAINSELKTMNIENPTIKDVSEAVINIRRSKLPDPAVTGNAGSFFKNPEIPLDQFGNLKSAFPDIISYPTENGKQKLAAGWMIERCGLKGFEWKGAGVHPKQALVLVNKGNSTGQEIFELSEIVISRVKEKFGVTLEREVNII
jgi:UDP-N-acetylmuramate dehydrogenase